MDSGKPHGVFGHGTREAVLAAIHVLGPVTTADVSRAVGTGSDHATRAVRHFERYGLVRVNRNGANRSYATIDWRSPIYGETRAVAARFASILELRGKPRVAHRWGVGRGRLPVHDYVGLFGSPTASRVLLQVAAAGETDVRTLMDVLGLEESLVREVLARLERDGLVRRRSDGKRRPVSLDPRHPASAEIAALLRAVMRANAEHVPLAQHAARARRKAAAIPKRDRARRSPLNAAAAMLAFLDPRYARALVVLATEPLTGAKLARRLGLSRGAGRLIGRSLARAGLVREAAARGRHVAETTFALHEDHPAAAELRALLETAAHLCGVAAAARATLRPKIAGTHASRPDAVWPPDHRGRLSLLLAVHAGAATIDELSAATDRPHHVVRRRMLGLVFAKLARPGFDGTVLSFAADAAHPLASEIEALLTALTAAGVEPSGLRTMYAR